MNQKNVEKPKNRSVGIYISQHYVDGVELTYNAGRIILEKFFHFPIRKGEEEGFLLDTSFEKTGLIREKLADIARAIGRNQDVFTALKPKDSIARFFTMPRVPEKGRQEAIKFEAKKYIPFRLEEICANSFVVKEDTRLGKMDVFFTAGKKEQISHLLGTIGSAGLRTFTIDTVAFSLIRTFEFNRQLDPKNISLILYLEQEIASMIMVKDSIPYLIRDIYFSSDESNIMEKIMHEIRLSLDFLKRQFAVEGIQKIILAGEYTFSGWQDYLTRNLEIPVEEGVLRGDLVGAKDTLPLGIAVAFGLALRGVERPRKVQVNVLPVAAAPVKHELLKDILAHGIIIAVILVLFSIYFSLPLFAIKNKIKEVRGYIPSTLDAGIKGEPLVRVEALKKELKSKVMFLDEIVGKRINLAQTLQTVATLVPADGWFTEIKYTEVWTKEQDKEYIKTVSRSLSIQGILLGPDKQQELNTVNTMVKKGQNDTYFAGVFKNVQLTSAKTITLKKKEVTQFECVLSKE